MSSRGANSGEVNVKVIVRVRPLSEGEKRDPGQSSVVSTRVESREIVIAQSLRKNSEGHHFTRTFAFDGVCNQYTTQARLFSQHVVPIVDEVLLGFNCTIFAYGQTGTGKTYTMEGDLGALAPPAAATQTTAGRRPSLLPPAELLLPLSEHAGIIPRAVHYIFERLDEQGAEYSVRVSYLEIYNEELNDLLNDAQSQPPLRLFDDSVGKKGLSVDKLEELPVNNPQDIMNILGIACKRRRTAETLLNQQSSRSHSIFTILIHMKEPNIDGDDVIKIGKLNLVDLAGSENIQRSGAIKDRAKEAGMINQSLLTLGRVINALVERSSYIPYRDSKLTRLLQESLGGRTKTCIVATVSPSSLCVEESLSTLDYAFRAKNIRNRPEVNQRMTKRAVLRELTSEIERLKNELISTREKVGVYMPYEQFLEMESKLHQQSTDMGEAASEIDRLRAAAVTDEAERLALRNSVKSLTSSLASANLENQQLTKSLGETEETLKSAREQLQQTQSIAGFMRTQSETVREQYAETVSLLTTVCAKVSAGGRQLASLREVLTRYVAQQAAALKAQGSAQQDCLTKLSESRAKVTATTKDLLKNVVNFTRDKRESLEGQLRDTEEHLQVSLAQHLEELTSNIGNAVEVATESMNVIDAMIKEEVQRIATADGESAQVVAALVHELESTAVTLQEQQKTLQVAVEEQISQAAERGTQAFKEVETNLSAAQEGVNSVGAELVQALDSYNDDVSSLITTENENAASLAQQLRSSFELQLQEFLEAQQQRLASVERKFAARKEEQRIRVEDAATAASKKLSSVVETAKSAEATRSQDASELLRTLRSGTLLSANAAVDLQRNLSRVEVECLRRQTASQSQVESLLQATVPETIDAAMKALKAEFGSTCQSAAESSEALRVGLCGLKEMVCSTTSKTFDGVTGAAEQAASTLVGAADLVQTVTVKIGSAEEEKVMRDLHKQLDVALQPTGFTPRLPNLPPHAVEAPGPLPSDEEILASVQDQQKSSLPSSMSTPPQNNLHNLPGSRSSPSPQAAAESTDPSVLEVAESSERHQVPEIARAKSFMSAGRLAGSSRKRSTSASDRRLLVVVRSKTTNALSPKSVSCEQLRADENDDCNSVTEGENLEPPRPSRIPAKVSGTKKRPPPLCAARSDSLHQGSNSQRHQENAA